VQLGEGATWDGVDATLRDAILKASIDLNASLYVFATTNGQHSARSFHAAGGAADVSRVDGTKFSLMPNAMAQEVGAQVGNAILNHIPPGRRAELITPLGSAQRFYREPWSQTDAARLVAAHRSHVHVSIR